MKIFKIKKFRKKLRERLALSSEILAKDLQLYTGITIDCETVAFIEFSIVFDELCCEGFPGSLQVIHVDNQVENILDYVLDAPEPFPSFKDRVLFTYELIEDEEIGDEIEKIVMDEVAKWIAKVWKEMEKSELNYPVFITQEDPIYWYNLRKEKWLDQPLPLDSENNWKKVTSNFT